MADQRTKDIAARAAYELARLNRERTLMQVRRQARHFLNMLNEVPDDAVGTAGIICPLDSPG